MSPQNPMVMVNLATTLGSKHAEEALELFDASLALAPNVPESHANKGALLKDLVTLLPTFGSFFFFCGKWDFFWRWRGTHKAGYCRGTISILQFRHLRVSFFFCFCDRVATKKRWSIFNWQTSFNRRTQPTCSVIFPLVRMQLGSNHISSDFREKKCDILFPSKK